MIYLILIIAIMLIHTFFGICSYFYWKKFWANRYKKWTKGNHKHAILCSLFGIVALWAVWMTIQDIKREDKLWTKK